MNPPSPAKRNILLVDDDALVLGVLSLVLRNAGHEVIQSNSGAEALGLAEQFTPDLVLIDIGMPGMSGLELANQLKSKTAIPFMFVSAHSENEIVRQATEYGAVGYLLKPFEPAQVMPAVETALSRADEIRHLRRTEENLTAALNAGRETSMAVGLLMRAYHTDRNTAYDVLRDYSRSHRRKINDVAKDLLSAEEMFNGFRQMFGAPQNK